ncbi:hypothetical protein Pelo_19377 [Pelomyxa schiedti]|nr:hypothetical protein Pelo_19377 [Pelomyxa schiedti]
MIFDGMVVYVVGGGMGMGMSMSMRTGTGKGAGADVAVGDAVTHVIHDDEPQDVMHDLVEKASAIGARVVHKTFLLDSILCNCKLEESDYEYTIRKRAGYPAVEEEDRKPKRPRVEEETTSEPQGYPQFKLPPAYTYTN